MQLSNEIKLTVIDPESDFAYLPNIHELISGTKSPEQLKLSKRKILQIKGHEFIVERVIKIETTKKYLKLESEEKIGYDICIAAIGGVNNTFGIKNVETKSIPFKSIDNCSAIEEKISQLFKERRKEINIVIVGGGIEGIEALGEILRKYRKKKNLNVNVVEASDQLLPGFSNALDMEIRKICKPYKVNFNTKSSVVVLSDNKVELSTGAILPSDVTIWTGGVKAPAILTESGLIGNNDKWALVDENLKSKYADNVFILGDAAQLPEPISKQAYHAIKMGKLMSDNLNRIIKGKVLQAFKPSSKPTIITFGDLDTFFVHSDFVIAGQSLSLLKESIYRYVMNHYTSTNNLSSLLSIPEDIGKSAIDIIRGSDNLISAILSLPNTRILSQTFLKLRNQ